MKTVAAILVVKAERRYKCWVWQCKGGQPFTVFPAYPPEQGVSAMALDEVKEVALMQIKAT